MANTLNEIMAELLDEFEKNPQANVEELLQNMLKDNGMDDSVIAELNEGMAFIDELDKNVEDIQVARANGKSRKSWLMGNMNKMLDGRTDEEKIEVLEAIDNTIKKVETDTYATTNEEEK